MIYPLAIGGACIITSIIGIRFVKLGKIKYNGALYKGFIVTAITSLLILYPVTDSVIGLDNSYSNSGKNFDGMDLYICGVVGFVITGLLIWITEYYTGTNYRPVKISCSIFNNRSWDKCYSRFSYFNGSYGNTSINYCSWNFIYK